MVPAHALPEDPGTLLYTKVTRTEPLAGKSITFDLYIPKQSKLHPIVVVGHGFQRTKQQMAGWGQALAQRGYIAAAPNFPGGLTTDHAIKGAIISALLGWMDKQGQLPGSPLLGRVDGARRAAVGHSAGGLGAVLAAATDATIKVVVGLDPVDTTDQGKNVAAKVKAPVVFIRAEPSACNAQGSAAGIFGALVSPRLSLQVIGANHCDPELPSDGLCALLCGAAVPQRQALFRRYLFATLDQILLCDGTMATWLGGAKAKADPGIKGIVAQSFPPPAGAWCSSSPDAGPADAGVVDTGSVVDLISADLSREASTLADVTTIEVSPMADGAIDPAADEGGCGCRVSGPGPGPGQAHVLLLFLLALVWRLSRSAAR